MKKMFLIAFVLFNTAVFSQNRISGTVSNEKKQPLEGASVYINNTTIGVSTKSNGTFELNLKEGIHELIVSYIGYKTIQLNLNTDTYTKPLSLQLEIEENTLDEIVIKRTVYDDEWKYNLKSFKQAFFGRTKLAKECTILNPKVLSFEYNNKSGVLVAEAREPLQIRHNGLGYIISYDLVEFSLGRKRLFFSGYTKYSNLKKSIKRKWKRNRLKAYNGSQVHFLNSLITNKLKSDGFIVNQFKRVLNPDRPSEEKIKLARELVSLQNSRINFSKTITNPQSALDSAIIVIQNSSRPKYRDYLYKKNVPHKEMISKIENDFFLDFENYLSIIYTKEAEEENYLIGMFGKRKKATGMQTSNIVLIDGKSKIDNSGILINPHAIFVEGYWGFESFANMLPADYQPPKD